MNNQLVSGVDVNSWNPLLVNPTPSPFTSFVFPRTYTSSFRVVNDLLLSSCCSNDIHLNVHYKQLLDEVFVISVIIKVEVL